ncbi:radical SAM protein [Desulfotruncus alcoholivorax]|uniref:radical SAM protein n=1 Tax=Desulfotruncus alcoholivorax TaxID=265477 RepID=UPI0003F6E96D|nr:radical SAM protein [Desulfotruncus alcoholivorax]
MGDLLKNNLPNNVERLIYWAAGHSNILPLTSQCNVKCVFCSNLQNPPGVEAFNLKPLKTEQLSNIITLLDPRKPVVIGESATRINEGEPFTHPKIKEFLSTIRQALPHTTIQITTNGSLLDAGQLEFLHSISPVTIYLSLNSLNLRRQIMGDLRSENAVAAAALLGQYGLNWHGSVVAMPHLTGWEDLKETISYLDSCGAQTIRIFIPGFTRLAQAQLRYPGTMPEQLRQTVAELASKTKAPLTVEPPLITDLQPEVAGVIPNSPAFTAGIRRGNIIQTVNGKEAFSRVHAFYMVKKTANPILLARNGAKANKVVINKAAGESSGLVMEYDIDLSLIEDITQISLRRSAANTVLLASEMAAKVLTMALNKYNNDQLFTVIPVPNLFFGGSIKTAGLLVMDDIINTLGDYLKNKYSTPDLVILPQIAFDPGGRDLLGRHWSEIESIFSIPVEVL